MATWHEITRDPEYQELSEQGKALVKQGFFEREISSDPEFKTFSPQTQKAVFDDFWQTPDDTGQGIVTSTLGSAARGFGEIVPGTLQGVGALTGITPISDLGESARAGLEYVAPVNPIYEQGIPAKVANVAGNVASIIGTSGVGGLAGKVLGAERAAAAGSAAARQALTNQAIQAGAKSALYGTGFAQGAAAKAEENKRLGITGAEGYLNLLGGGISELAPEMLPFGTALESAAARRLLGGVDDAAGRVIPGIRMSAAQEAAEGGSTQVLSNLSTQLTAPTGVEAPDLFEGAGEAALWEGVGGAMFGAINKLGRTPPEKQTDEQRAYAAELGAVPVNSSPPITPEESLENFNQGGIPVVSPDGVVTTLPFNREDIRATDLPFNREDIRASELPFTREDIRPTQLPFNREDIRSTELPFSRQNIRGLSQLGQPAISPGLTAAVNTADSIVTTAENTSSDVSQATTAARNIIQGVVNTPQPQVAPAELPAVTPSPAMEMPEKTSQTITDSNGEIAPEMSVLPPTVQAGAGAGEAIQAPTLDELVAAGLPQDEANRLVSAWASDTEPGTIPSADVIAKRYKRLKESEKDAETIQFEKGVSLADHIENLELTGIPKKDIQKSIVKDTGLDIDDVSQMIDAVRRFRGIPQKAGQNAAGIQIGSNDAWIAWRDAKLAKKQPQPIETAPDAIQEQITDEGLLRQERPEMELQGLGEGNAQPQEVAAEGQIQEEVAPKKRGRKPALAPQAQSMLAQAAAINAGTEKVTPSTDEFVQKITGQQPITPQGTPTPATEGKVMPRGSAIERDLLKPYANISIPDLEALPESDWSRRRDYLEGKMRNNQQEKSQLLKTPKSNWENREYNENARINDVAASLRAAIQDMQSSRPDLENQFRTKSSTQAESGEAPRGSAIERDVTKPEQMTPEEALETLLQRIEMLDDRRAELKKQNTFSRGKNTKKEKEARAAREEELAHIKDEMLSLSDIIDQIREASTASKQRDAIPREYIDKNNLAIPQGYVKQGDLYVFSPQTTAAETPKLDFFSSTLQEAKGEAVESLREAMNSGSGRFKGRNITLLVTPSSRDDVMLQVTRVSNEGEPQGHQDIINEQDFNDELKDQDNLDVVLEHIRPDIGQARTLGAFGIPKFRKPVSFNYRLRLREVGPGTTPAGFISSEGRDVSYDRPLTRREMSDFEMSPVGATPLTAQTTTVAAPTDSASTKVVTNSGLGVSPVVQAMMETFAKASQAWGQAKAAIREQLSSSKEAVFLALAEDDFVMERNGNVVTVAIPKGGSDAFSLAGLGTALDKYFRFGDGKGLAKVTKKKGEPFTITFGNESDAANFMQYDGRTPSQLNDDFKNLFQKLEEEQTNEASEAQTPTPSRKGAGASGGVQSEPVEGSIPTVEQESATTAIESTEKTDIAKEAMRFLESDLTDTQRAKWTPEMFTAAQAFFDSGGKDMDVLRAAFPKLVGSRPIVQAYRKADKEASEAQAKREAAEAAMAREVEKATKEQAKLEADQKQREELGLKTLNSLIQKTRTNVVQGSVKSSDANQAVAILNKSGAIPNVLFTWIGTSKDFLADPANRARYPETWRAVSNNNNAEGWSENGQPIVFTDNVGVSDLDRNLAKLQGTTPEIAAVRRVILHENIHKGMFFLNRKDKMKLFEFLHRLYSPEELDQLAKSYDEYSDWRINQDSYFSIIEEAMTRDFDSMAEIPRDGIWAEFMQFLRDIWQKITGKTGEPTLKNYKDVFRLIRNSLKNSEAANADRLKNGGATMMSMSEFISNVTPEQDAAYAKAVADGDMDTAQRMVDEAAKAAGYPKKVWHVSENQPEKNFRVRGNRGYGAYFSDEKQDYPGEGKMYFLKLGNTKTVGFGETWEIGEIPEGLDSLSEPSPIGVGGNDYVVFNPNQIKSADPVTRDEQGNVIPLSRRFQSASNDIRFSKVEYDSPNEAAFNSGAEVARNADYDERDKAVRSTIRAAYDLAPKNNGPSVPLDQLFDIAKQSMPDLTENEFSQILQDLYEDSGALLQAGESPFIVTTSDGQRAGSVIIVSSLPTGAMASAIDPESASTKEFTENIKAINNGTLKAAFDGVQFVNIKPVDHIVKPNKSYEKIAIDYVDGLMGEGQSIEQIATSIMTPMFFDSVGASNDVKARQALTSEVLRRVTDLNGLSNTRLAAKRLEKLEDLLGSFWQGLGTESGGNQGQRAFIIGSPRYSWMFLKNTVKKELKQRRDNILNVQFGNDNATSFTQNSYENADKANQMAVDNVASEAEFTQEADSDADLLRDGEATLDAKQKTIWEKVKDAIRTKALIAKALEAMRARKAGNKAKASISEEARNAIFQMTEEELLALDAKMDKVIADGAKTFLGEESAADTQEKKTVRKKREKMVEVTKKRAEKGLTLESLDSDSALSKMLREINKARRGAEVPLKNPIPWRKLLSQKAKTVEEYRQRIFDAISANEELKSATPEQKARLADLFTEAWESNRKRILDGMQERLIREKEAKGDLSKKGAEALQEQRMRMVEDINLGIFDNDEIAKIMAEKFGIKSEFTDAEREKIESLIEVLQDEKLNRVKRNKAAYELLETLSAQTDIPISKLLANFWVSSVLSGMNTVFSIGMSVFSGMGELTTTLYRIFVSAFSNPKQLPSEVAAAFKTLARVLSAVPRHANRAWQYLVTGDQAFLDPTMNDALKNMDWDSIGKNTQLAEQMAKSDKTLQKVMGLFMRTVSRLLTALDLFNSGLTKEGSLSLVFRQLNLDPSKIEMLEKKSDLKAYKAQVIRDYFNNVQPKTFNEKALVESYAMAEMMKALDELGSVSENADQMAMQGAMTLDPSGIGGYGYRFVKLMMKSAESGADKLVERNLRKWDEAQGASDKTEAGVKLALSYIFQFAAYNAANLVGVRFARFAGNKFNQSLSFLPIIGALRLYEAEFDADRIRGKEAFTDMIKRNQLTGVMAAAIGYVFLKAIAEEPDDEKRGWFINGGWSNLTPEKKQQKLASGQKEYTLGFGDTVINYGNWPGSGIIAAIGGLSDLIRFSPEQWSEKTVSNKLMSATASGVFSALEVPALSQFQELFGSSLSSKDPNEQKLTKFARVIGNYAGGFVPRILKDIDYLADPNLRKYETLWEKTASHIPVYRRYEGKEYYDILGQQIQRNIYPGSREFMVKPTDPAYKVLGALNSRGIWLTPANAEHRMVGKGARRRSLTQEEADNYSLETGKGYKQMLLRYGQRALQMPTERAKAFLLDKADDVRDRALKKVYRGYTPAS